MAAVVDASNPILVRFEMRAIAHPVMGMLSMFILGGLIYYYKSDQDAATNLAPKLLMGLAGLQTFFGIWWIFAPEIGLKYFQFVFSGLITLFYGLAPDRTLVGKLVALLALVNFFCLINRFPLLGFGGLQPDFDNIVSTTGVGNSCVQYFNYQLPPGAVNVFAKCREFLNVLEFAGLAMTCMQPFIVFISYLLFESP